MTETEKLIRELRKDDVRVAVLALECSGGDAEVWFRPGNNGDLGYLFVGDELITSIRTYEIGQTREGS